MMHYSVQPRDRIFVKGYGFLSFAKNMCRNIGKNIAKNLSVKLSPGMLAMRQKLLDHAKKSAIDALKTSSKRVIRKTAEATGDLIGNEIADRITKVSKTLPQNNSETITNEHDQEIPTERCISPEERLQIIVELRII